MQFRTIKVIILILHYRIFSYFLVLKLENSDVFSLPCWEEQQVQVNGFIKLSIFKNLPKRNRKKKVRFI